jgi:uncharacterized protein (DUF2336 family)
MELEAAIGAATHAKRGEDLRRVTELFIAGADSFNHEHVAIFERILGLLIEEIETAVLAEIGERLAPVKNAPPAIVRSLANHDEIAVAGLVLAQSERLTPADLVQIAETKGQAHLMAISNRSRVDEPVTDVLVRRGDNAVVRSVAGNNGARFSEGGMSTLAERAVADEMIAEKVVQRADVPPDVFCKLLVAATSVVRKRLLAVLGPDVRSDANRVLERVSGEIADRAPVRRTYGTAIRRVLVESAPDLTEDHLVTYASSGEIEESIATLSLLSSLPTQKIDQFVEMDEHNNLLIICRAAGLTWRGARVIVLLTRAGRGLGPTQFKKLERAFDDITETDAHQMVRLWHLDS